MKTYASIFSGGEGAGAGARQAGLRHLWGIELDTRIAAVAQSNDFDVRVADVREVDPAALARPDVLHASPPCPSFSTAKHGGEETALDIELAQATARFVRVLRPKTFTLENVWMYRKSESWRVIAQALAECGYWFDVAHINSADMGVPQTRKRMWVRAKLGAFVPHLPPPEPWVGWYEAIEDLIHGLEDTEFAPWQLERMPAELRETVLLAQGHYKDGPLITRATDAPAGTVTANSNMASMRALLVTNQYAAPSDVPDREPKIAPGSEPAPTVTTGSTGRLRAFLTTGQFNAPHGTPGRGPQIRDESQPANTVTASTRGDWRGFVAGATSDGFATRDASEPANTVLASNHRRPTRGFVMDGQNMSGPALRQCDEPAFTVTNPGKATPRAAVHGRVVMISLRCLARWQTLPDEYLLPDKKGLASRVIGNAVPSLLYQKILEDLT